MSLFRPAFGQVWQYHGDDPMILLFPTHDDTSGAGGAWVVIYIHHDYLSGPVTMYGLHDDPAERIDGYKLLQA